MANQTNKRKITKPIVPIFPFENLFFLNGSGIAEKLPDWAVFYIKVGIALATFDKDDIRLVLALATPTRTYAAAFISAGINYARSFIPQEKTDEEYARYIFSLEPGTPVIYRDLDRKKNGIIEKKINSPDGKVYIGIQLEKGQWKYLTPDKARLVTVDERECIRLPAHQMGRQITTSSTFIRSVYTANANEFTLETRLESAIVGPMSSIYEELETNLIFKSEAEDIPGKLSEFIRGYKEHPKGIAFRTCISSIYARKKPKLPIKENPFVVIFDGSSAFIRSRDLWRNQNWVVILDKTDRNLLYAAEHLTYEFLNRVEKAIKLDLPTIPDGVDAMVFGVTI